jgi:hypothetical protein
MRPRLSITCAVLGLCLPYGVEAKARQLDGDEMRSAVFVETVALPSPGEFLLAVDKQFDPNWSQLVKASVPATTTRREQLALQLGVLLADSYVAIEAQDGQAAKNAGRDLIATARKLNVGQNVLARGQSIADIADRADWRTLREELDAMQNDIRLSMQEQNDHALLVFLMTGSWVRQMELAAALAEANPSPRAFALITQPAILNHLLERMASLRTKDRSSPLAKRFLSKLQETKAHMDKGVYAPLPEDSVRGIAATMASLLATTAEPPPKP